jgi:IS30 family transposase
MKPLTGLFPVTGKCDLILCSVASNSAMGTCVERSTRYTMLLHMSNGHSADEAAKAMITASAELPADLRKTPTYDRGVEMARYAQIQIAIDADMYLCDPHSPWFGQPCCRHARRLGQ